MSWSHNFFLSFSKRIFQFYIKSNIMFSESSVSESTLDEINVSKQWQNLNIYDEEQKNETKHENSSSFIDNKALRMMEKMGYKSGSGLGKAEQGIKQVINVNTIVGKRGFGLKMRDIEDRMEKWDFSREEIIVEEKVDWLENQEQTLNNNIFQDINFWMKEGAQKLDVENEFDFCDKDILHDVLQAKNIFDEFDLLELCQARAKANPFETIRSVFFMNRAALKMANIDAATEFMFTNIDQNTYHKNNSGPFYFADVCAGPGGFTEYILWRKQWLFKGFGMTLKDENDFKVHESTCASSAMFQAFYGERGDGNVCCPENIQNFKDKVLHETEGKGVHFMMSDGGFSVEGKENLQEILSKNIYICQCLVALEVVRVHGHFVTKLFDVFTPFSVGLLYLMYKCFEKVSIFKPNSSRPANSERYFICSGLKNSDIVQGIKSYLWVIVKRLWEIKDNEEKDILEIVPLEIMKGDKNFYCYIVNSNNRLGKQQTIGLQKLAAFCKNPTLTEVRQETLRKRCLDYWKIPDTTRVSVQYTVDDLLNTVIDKPEILLVEPREVNNFNILNLTVADLEDWHYCPMYSPKNSSNCNFYAGVGFSKVCRLQWKKWVKVKNLQLAKGTLLYGELVKEKITVRKETVKNANAQYFRYSLHVIDALCLGGKNLTNLSFKERLMLIQIYCKSVNKETSLNTVRIRPKMINKLSDLDSLSLTRKAQSESYVFSLPVFGCNSFSEVYDVNSLILLKTNENQSFHSTYVLRVQIFINPIDDQEDGLSLENLKTWIKQKL